MTLGKVNNLNTVILCFDYLTPYEVILNLSMKRLSNITSSQRLELKLLKHSGTCILIGNGYSHLILVPLRDITYSEDITSET